MKRLFNNKGGVLIFSSVIAAIVVHVLFNCHSDNEWWVAKWGAGDILTYIGTIVLGWLAIWQNEELKKSNKESQDRLERISERANEINVISKIIEYEISKKSAVEKTFEDYEEKCNPQRYVNAINGVDSGKIETDEKIAIIDEMELDESYSRLCSKLDINPGEKHREKIAEEIEELYSETKKLIELIRKDSSEQKQGIHDMFRNQIGKVKAARVGLQIAKNVFLMDKQKELDALIRGDISLKEVKTIY